MFQTQLFAGWFQGIAGALMFFGSLFLILLVLVQRGRGGGLSGAFGGMGGQSAFGAKAGDTFTKITVITATIWILLCMAAVRFTGNETTSILDDDPVANVETDSDLDGGSVDDIDTGTSSSILDAAADGAAVGDGEEAGAGESISDSAPADDAAGETGAAGEADAAVEAGDEVQAEVESVEAAAESAGE